MCPSPDWSVSIRIRRSRCVAPACIRAQLRSRTISTRLFLMSFGPGRHEDFAGHPLFIWWDADIRRLSAAAKALCEDPNNSLVLSLASVWEMQIKQQHGKLTP